MSYLLKEWKGRPLHRTLASRHSINHALYPQKENALIAIKSTVSPVNFTPHICASGVYRILKNNKFCLKFASSYLLICLWAGLHQWLLLTKVQGIQLEGMQCRKQHAKNKKMRGKGKRAFSFFHTSFFCSVPQLTEPGRGYPKTKFHLNQVTYWQHKGCVVSAWLGLTRPISVAESRMKPDTWPLCSRCWRGPAHNHVRKLKGKILSQKFHSSQDKSFNCQSKPTRG